MYFKVLLDVSIDTPLTYASDTFIPFGSRVKVPLQNKEVLGTALDLDEHYGGKAKQVLEIYQPVITKELFSLLEFTSYYWCTPLRKVLHTILPTGVKKNIKKRSVTYLETTKTKKILLEEIQRRKSLSEKELLSFFLEEKKVLLKNINHTKALKKLLEEGWLQKQETHDEHAFFQNCDFFPIKPKVLTSEQQQVLNTIDLKPHLLFGVTGSGKSEIYYHLIDKTLKEEKSVIFLVPETTLAAQMIENLQKRFPGHTALLHYKMSQGERNHQWQELLKGQKKMVVGPRSAVFAPLQNLGLIIVDEEHEAAYKQEEMPCFHARDVAIVRAHNNQCPIILGSATPSFESFRHALSGKYQLSRLQKRPKSSVLPKVHRVDMQKEMERGNAFFSEALIHGMQKRLGLGEQTILFLNRRGSHTSLLCSTCQEPVNCPHCSVTLTHHQKKGALVCHLCHFHTPPPTKCPKCQHEMLSFRGWGCEKVEKALLALMPTCRVIRMDADTTAKKGAMETMLKAFATGKGDILLGTQMVIKGLNFPQVTLVGILNADQPLHIPDFRSSELTFQQITQVAGRAGRSFLGGEVILQSFLKDHPTITKGAKQDYPSFYDEEIETRKLFNFPPFVRCIRLIIKGKEEGRTLAYAEKLRTLCLNNLPNTYEIYPTSPCGFAKINDYYRFHFLIKGKQISFFCSWMQTLPFAFSSGSIKVKVDIDPLTTFF